MKDLFLLFILFLSTNFYSQEKLLTRNGIIIFEASVASFYEVKAKNINSSCILNTKTGEIAVLALIKGFRFKIALMEEHFNENYIESFKYPKAIFKGKIENLDVNTLSNTFKKYTISGIIELHGKTKSITIIANIKKYGNGIEINSNFNLNPSDFDIKIPNIVKNKVAKTVEVFLDFNFKGED